MIDNKTLQRMIALAKQGDGEAQRILAEEYRGLVRALANKFYLVGGDKDDLLQEGMIGLFFAITNYDESKGAFAPFVHTCVFRQIVSAVRKSIGDKNKPLSNYIEITSLENVASAESPLASLLSKEYAEKVSDCMTNQLSVKERKVMELFAEGYCYDDICQMTGYTYKSVDGALQRAKRKLALALKND